MHSFYQPTKIPLYLYRVKKKHYTIAVFVPELACPFQCVYCNQKKISGQLKIPEETDVINNIEKYLSTIDHEKHDVEIGFFGGNFTGIPFEDQKNLLSLAEPYIAAGKIQSIKLSTRPDYINQEILDFLKDHHVQTIELGAQSMSNEVLKASRRGHTAEDTEMASQLIKENGFRLGLQMMIGLPGGDAEKSTYTAKKICELGADDTRIYPCLLIRGTVLHDWYDAKKYQPLSLEEAVEQTKNIMSVFQKHHVNIIRIGLHPSEMLTPEKDLVAGPFHPAFRELVLTEIWNDLLKPLFKKSAHSNISIYVPASELNYAIGHQSKNRKILEKHYRQVSFNRDVQLTERNFRIDFS